MSTTSYPTTELGSAASAASRAPILLYGVATYLFFLAVFVYTIGFVGGFVVPKHIENGLLAGPAERGPRRRRSSSPCSRSSTA